MIRLLRSLIVLLLVPLSTLPALAKSKPKSAVHKKTAAKKKTSNKVAKKKTVKGRTKPDLEARALIRKKAPFVLEQRFRGDVLRLNKDGTFSRENSTAHTAQGSWRVKQGKLRLKWNTGEELAYNLTFSGKNPIVAGQAADKSKRYVLNSAD